MFSLKRLSKRKKKNGWQLGSVQAFKKIHSRFGEEKNLVWREGESKMAPQSRYQVKFNQLTTIINHSPVKCDALLLCRLFGKIQTLKITLGR